MAVLIPVMYYDLVQHRIPNFLTFSAIVFGLLTLFLVGDRGMMLFHILGLLVGFGLFYVFYLFGWVGGGDVKLVGAIGLLKGTWPLLSILIYTAVFGGILSLVFLATALIKKVPLKGLRIPYGTAIVLGVFAYLGKQYGVWVV